MSLMLSITSDYVESQGDARPYLARIAAAGFTHVHWCHQWNTDFLYSEPEIDQISKWFSQYGLRLLNLHASQGVQKLWYAHEEHRRHAGVELVENRIRMAARLGADVIILHAPTAAAVEDRARWLAPLRRSLDALLPFARAHGIRIALENMEGDDFDLLTTLLAEYDGEGLGLCYDSGHGNIGAGGLDHLERALDRLIALHLHDNDGTGDQHRVPFSGSVDWPRLARLIARSPCSRCLNLEAMLDRSGGEDEDAFLRRAHAAGARLAGLVAEAGSQPVTAAHTGAAGWTDTPSSR